MGDLKKKQAKPSIEELNAEREQRAAKPQTVKKMVKQTSKPMKDRSVSARMQTATWEKFSAINTLQGMSNNSVLNMLVTQYVRENKHLLKEEADE